MKRFSGLPVCNVLDVLTKKVVSRLVLEHVKKGEAKLAYVIRAYIVTCVVKLRDVRPNTDKGNAKI